MYALLLIIVASVLADFDRELEYVAALRTGGLQRLSEVQCRRLLEESDVTNEQRTQLNIELSKTLTARALNSRQPQRDQYWRQTHAVLDKAIAETSDPSVRILLEMQLGLTMLEQAEWSRREGEIRAATEGDWQTSRLLLRKAIAQLKQVEAGLVDLNRRNAGRDGAMSSEEIAELRRNAGYQLSRGYRNQAITYAGQPGDQVKSLTAALKYLRPIASDTVADELVWKSRVDRIECYRLRGDLERASQLITDANAKNVPPEFLGRLAAEGVRLALAARNPQTALKFVQSQQANNDHPELELARIETLVALAVKKPNESKAYQLEAAQIAARMDQQHGTYWGLRGEILITKLSGSREAASPESNLLDTTAKTLLRQDQPGKAIDTFVRAAEQAKRDGRHDEAFEYLHKAAIVNHQEKQLQPAVDRFRHAATSYPDHPKAAEAHLLAVFDAAELYQNYARSGQENDAAKKVELYETLLKEHLDKWPDQQPANQARVWYGRLATAKGNWTAAIDAYRNVAAGSKLAAEAYGRLGELYQRKFASSPDGVQEAREWMAVRATKERNPTAASVLLSELAELSLLVAPQDYALADRCLEAVLQNGTAISDELQAMRVVSLAGRNETQRARDALTKLLPLPAEPLLSLLKGLQSVRDLRPGDGLLQSMSTDCIKLLQSYRAQLTPEDNLLVQQTAADFATVPEAVAVYQRLAAEHPNHDRIQWRYAELVSQGRDKASREAALKQWRSIVRRSKPQSSEWFRGKLGVAQAHFDAGEHETSKEVIELLMALYPTMGGEPLKAAFERLRDRIK